MPIEIDPVRRGKRRPRRVSKKTTKTPTAKQKQLQKLKDMRDKVMGTKKVMTAAMGGQAKASKKRAMSEAERRRFMERLKKGPGKPKVAMPRPGRGGARGRVVAGALKGLAGLMGKAGKAAGSKAAEAFKKAKARKPGGRLTSDDLKRASNFMARRKQLSGKGRR